MVLLASAILVQYMKVYLTSFICIGQYPEGELTYCSHRTNI